MLRVAAVAAFLVLAVVPSSSGGPASTNRPIAHSAEIVLSTFRVPGSGTNLLPWPTGRGSLLRNGTGPAAAP